MADLARMSINQATTRTQFSLQEAIIEYSKAGIPGIAIWRDKLAECGLTKARQLIEDHGLQISGLCRAGQFSTRNKIKRQFILDNNRRAIDEAAALKADCLIVVAGGVPGGSKDIMEARKMIFDGLAALLPYARAAKVPLAIEPLHPMYAGDRCAINTLSQALTLCHELGAGAGVAIDVYHVWWDPQLEEQISRANKKILAFHVCDWLVPTKDLLLDRGMMGDGIIDIPKIRGWIDNSGYKGLIEVEIFSANNWWKRMGKDVVRTCVQRFVDKV